MLSQEKSFGTSSVNPSQQFPQSSLKVSKTEGKQFSSNESDSQLNSPFITIKVKDVVNDMPNFDLIYVNENDTVADVLNVFKKNNIVSAPVKKPDENVFTGIIDMLDLVTFVDTKFAIPRDLARDSYDQMEQFAKHPIGTLMQISNRNKWLEVSFDETLSDLFEILSNSNSHRVAVINEAADLVGLVTQYGLLEWVNSHKHLFPRDIFMETLGNFEWTKEVKSIDMNKFVIDAFKEIWDQEVSGLAVVDDKGKLVSNISASDLTRVRALPVGELVHDLYQPIKQFLNLKTTLQEKIMKADQPSAVPIYVTSDASVEEVLNLMMLHRIHRVFVVDKVNQNPNGIISCSDLIRYFNQQCS